MTQPTPSAIEALPRLSRLLKRSFIRSFLEEALPLAPASSFLAVADGKKILGLAGEAATDADAGQLAGLSCAQHDLQLNGAVLGKLFAGCKVADPVNKAQIEKAAAFLARSLQEIMQREFLVRSLGAETLDKYREVGVMQRAVVHLNSTMKLRDVVQSLLDEVRRNAVAGQAGIVFLMDDAREQYTCLGSFGLSSGADPAALARSQLFAEIIEGDKGEIINDLQNDPRWRNEAPALQSLLMIPLRAPRLALGALVLANTVDAEGAAFQAVHLKRHATLAGVAGTAMANAFHFEQVQLILMALMQAMATAIDARDRCTAGHSQRVAQYALALAQAASEDHAFFPDVRFEENDLQEIFYAGLLHDVGKIGVREEVLTKTTRLPRTHLELIGMRLALWGELTGKPWQDLYAKFELINKAYDLADEDIEILYRYSRETLEVAGNVITILGEEERDKLLTPRGNLTEEEWLEIKRHPAESHRILRNIPFTAYFPNLLHLVVQHHERLDGSGYPYGVTANDILMQSRILAIVDVYDALRKDRHYKKALPREMALKILREEARRGKLDHGLVELFCQNVEHMEQNISVVDMDILSSCELMQ